MITQDCGDHKIDIKDRYKILLDTRNLEISLFWQRSNYFLVLNSGIALGFFSQVSSSSSMPPGPHLSAYFAVVLAAFGLLTSLLWFWVCLGGKFWQARWEQRLMDFEREHLAEAEFFAASPARLKRDVARSLNFHRLGFVQRFIYRMVLKKPSVSYAMIRLSMLFVLAWAGVIAAYLMFGVDVAFR